MAINFLEKSKGRRLPDFLIPDKGGLQRAGPCPRAKAQGMGAGQKKGRKDKYRKMENDPKPLGLKETSNTHEPLAQFPLPLRSRASNGRLFAMGSTGLLTRCARRSLLNRMFQSAIRGFLPQFRKA